MVSKFHQLYHLFGLFIPKNKAKFTFLPHILRYFSASTCNSLLFIFFSIFFYFKTFHFQTLRLSHQFHYFILIILPRYLHPKFMSALGTPIIYSYPSLFIYCPYWLHHSSATTRPIPGNYLIHMPSPQTYRAVIGVTISTNFSPTI